MLDRLAHDAAHAAPAGGGGWPREKQILFDGTGMPLESVNLGVVGAPHPGGGFRTPKPDEFGGAGEISVVLPDGGWLNDLERAFRRGEPYKNVEIVVPTAGRRWPAAHPHRGRDRRLREQRRRRPSAGDRSRSSTRSGR